MIKVLQILCALNDGGIEKLLFDYYRLFDKKDIKFDFAVNDQSVGMLERKFIDMGCSIFHYTKFRISFIKANRDLKRIIRNGNYDIIHSHIANRGFGVCNYARRHGAVVISHSHSCNEKESFAWKLIRKVTTHITVANSDYLFACGTDAGKWAWGKKNFTIMKNAIRLDNYVFSKKKRQEYRSLFKLNEEFVLLNVGRLSDQKNQLFLLDIFEAFSKTCICSKLFLVGDGDKKEELLNSIKQKGLDDKVFLLGSRDDVPSLLSMADIFLLPSNYEGLPISVIEAQCSGLPCLISNKVTTEVKILDSTEYLAIDKGSIDSWVEKLNYFLENPIDKGRVIDPSIIKECGYDIITESKKMQNFYKEIL